MLYTSAFTSLKRISNMTLKSYLALITVTTITLIIVAATLVFGYVLRSAYLDNISQRGLELARVMAHDDKVIEALHISNQGQVISLESYIESKRQQTDASFIVVVNKAALRLSHPIPERVGQPFIGDDIYPALQQGKSYTNVAKGSLGEAIRNFTPVIKNHQIIGAVSVGYLSKTTSELIYQHLKEAAWLVVFLYVLGVVIAIIFIAKLKRTFLSLEPEEIVQKFKEQELILDSIRDGIIAVDHEQNVTAINSTAIEWLTMKVMNANDVINKPLNEQSQSLSHFVLEAQGQITQRRFSLGKLAFIATLYPLLSKKGHFGYVIVFYPDHDEKSLEQELTSTQNYADLLRAKTHEYANRLNVLSGMLQAERYDDAINYLQQESDGDQAMLRQIIKTIENSAVAGLIFAKHNKAKDLHLELVIDSDCQLAQYSPQTNEALVTLVGNLLDNAFLAAWHYRQHRSPRVKLYISDRNAHIMLEVEDSGAGVEAELENRILDFGVSSKHNTEQNGIGLYLVKKIVDQYQGSLDWERSEEDTTVFSIYLDKQALKR
ncbi:ATP-binding protein [Marinomonas aquiplantarum]|uniref:histidine kinase n=1 Tax=Marinomonas aquiplantarum TaxID=491951 RepID=A0A366CYB8_9GAMM|nr:sensor histidine kinase [Marinomonas aquiplantarum]RBO82199.1 two-component system CitB family sensor kinase [Marinomonas aquiplantarum]